MMHIKNAAGLNFTSLLWCITFLLVYVLASEMVSGDSDLVLHIAYGNAIIDGGFPVVDPLLSGSSEAPILQEWLFEVIVAHLHNWFGLAGALVVFATLLGALVAALYSRMRSSNICMWVALLYGMIVIMALRPHLVIRPHLVSWLLSALLLILLEDWRSGKRDFKKTILAIISIMIFWANVHGGFLLGLVLIGVYVCEALTKKLKQNESSYLLEACCLLAVAALVTLINPWGIFLHHHLLSFLTNSFIISNTNDFQPPNFSDQTLQALIIVLCFIWPPLLLRIKHIRFKHWLLALGLTISACFSVRNIPFLGIIVLPIAAFHLQQWLNLSPRKIPQEILLSSKRMVDDEAGKTGWLWIVSIFLISTLLVNRGIVNVGLTSNAVPTAAIEWVDEQDSLHELPVFADFLAAGYLIYATPVKKVYLHALNANYSASRLQTWIRVANRETGWQNEIQNINWAFLLTGSPQAETLEESSCWQILYTDEMATVFQNNCTV